MPILRSPGFRELYCQIGTIPPAAGLDLGRQIGALIYWVGFTPGIPWGLPFFLPELDHLTALGIPRARKGPLAAISRGEKGGKGFLGGFLSSQPIPISGQKGNLGRWGPLGGFIHLGSWWLTGKGFPQKSCQGPLGREQPPKEGSRPALALTVRLFTQEARKKRGSIFS